MSESDSDHAHASVDDGGEVDVAAVAGQWLPQGMFAEHHPRSHDELLDRQAELATAAAASVGDLPAGENVVELYRELHGMLDRIAGIDTTATGEADLVAVAAEHERAARRMSSIGHRRVMDVCDRDAHTAAGYRSLHNFMAERLRIGDLRHRKEQMAAVSQMYNLQGELLAPRFPQTAAALADGAIGPDHVHTIVNAMARIPAAVAPGLVEAAEASLAYFARDFSPKTLTDLGARILGHLDPDGTVTDQRDRARQRRLLLSKHDAQQMSRLTATLDPTTRAMFNVVLAAWAAPGMNNPDDTQSPTGQREHADPDTLADAAARDARTPEQRNHDALRALLDYILKSGGLGDSHRGLPPHVIIAITEQELRERAGLGHTTTGATLPIADIIELAAHADLHLAVFADHTREVLHLGTAKRFANQAQRLALFARDGAHCTHPDCDMPFSHTEVHHAERDWADGGRTDIDALAAACPTHNRMVGPKPGQFTTHIVADGPDAGRPAWTRNTDGTRPPNPPRINRRNHIADTLRHHLDDSGLSGDTPARPKEVAPPDYRYAGPMRFTRLVHDGITVEILTPDDLDLAR
ncbi:HNH endonuclease signature motif containing protein [Gordonia sp. SL306]|uniref:HNH endonuclease signature motif containing protein n=1 Tax=Gordonia sp. SL306 TaxID=2995145 RepID=UPI00226F3D98|nr:HNH endonuclease signature motif containing protein [Gordonia sp. SL306]WAC56775.1 DUF222 domain-containing protein [Gordonia sp. SL306]